MNSLTDICKLELAGCSGVANKGCVSGSDKLDWHAYMPVYEERLEQYRNTAQHVLEVGVQGGGSIIMWQKYFTTAKIVGVELSGSEAMTKKSTQLFDANKSNIHWKTLDEIYTFHVSGGTYCPRLTYALSCCFSMSLEI